MPNIVQVNVTQTVAPTPNTLQEFGAIVTQGGTNTSPLTASLLTQASDLTALLGVTHTNSAIALVSTTATVTTSSAHGLPIGDTMLITVAGAVPAAYNGTWRCLIVDATSFSYTLTGSPGVCSTPGTYILASVSELVAQVTTFFAQGNSQSCYVLELGAGAVSSGVTLLTAYLVANPNSNYTPGALGYFYSYLLPREWDGNSGLLTLLQSYNSTTSKTYFFITTTLATYTLYTALDKCVVAMIESPALGVWSANALAAISYSAGVVTATTTTAHGVAVGQWFQINGVTPAGYNGWHQAQLGTTGSTLIYNVSTALGAESVLGTLVASYYANAGVTSTEFSLASMFWVTLNYAPSTTNRVTSTAFSYVFGVTPFPTRGTAALTTTLKAAGVNIVGTGAEGGISNTILLWGTTMDLADFTYWYSVDWAQINVDLDVANEIINGSNNPINPLYYNQPGINRLQGRAAATMARGVTYGLVLGLPVQTNYDGPDLGAALDAGKYVGSTVVNAVPFIPYSKENPSDYKLGKYAGLAIAYVPARGFIQIVININVSQFVAA